MDSQPALAIVIPALDEEGIIATVVAELAAAVPAAISTRVIVVDNGSADATASEARRAGASVVSEPVRGYGRACRAGVEAAAGAQIIVFADGDGSDEPTGLCALLSPLLEGSADLVVGVRVAARCEPGSMTFQQRAGNLVSTQVIGRLYGTCVSDLGPFRAIRRDHLLALDMSEMTYGWSAEMLVKSLRAGYRYREVPVGYRRRGAGYSKVGGNLGAGLRAGVAILSTALRYSVGPPTATATATATGSPARKGTVSDLLYVAAKAPRPGLVKTRIGASLGDAAAASLYSAFLADISGRLQWLPIRTAWFVTPDDGWPEIAAVVGPGWGTPVLQREGGWAERQDRLFRTAPARGEERVVLIASDSPQIGLDLLLEAFAALARSDLVLGPVLDGGYWLIGMRRYHPLLADLPMSTGTVLSELLARARQGGLTVHLLAPVFDVDETADLDRLALAARTRDDMPATLEALRSLAIATLAAPV